jgi:hypothetical protein
MSLRPPASEVFATAARAMSAVCLPRTFSTAFAQPAIFAAAALSVRSAYLLRSVSMAFPQALGAATHPFQRLWAGVAITGKRVTGILARLNTNRCATCGQAEHLNV